MYSTHTHSYQVLGEGVSAAIDCASHFRHQVHPGQADWYRGDKHRFFIGAQVVVSLVGEIFSVCLGKGHNNDQAMLLVTEMKEYLRDHNLRWLADGGYRFAPYLITPNDRNMPQEWNNTQKGLRSIVEVVISLAKHNKSLDTTFRQSPELQQLAIIVGYELTNMKIKDYPIKSL